MPNVVQKPGEAQAHTFPIQIGYQTLEVMQSSIFHSILMDLAAGQRVRQPNAIPALEVEILASGISADVLAQGWELLSKYGEIFEKFIFQNVLISIRSQWDWYIRNLGAFVLECLRAETGQSLSMATAKNLKNLGFKDLTSQISILCDAAGTQFTLGPSTELALVEMSLVRNLGLHNRWEIDDYYISKSSSLGFSLGDIRTFEVAELQIWHGALVQLVNATSLSIAKRFKDAASYASPR